MAVIRCVVHCALSLCEDVIVLITVRCNVVADGCVGAGYRTDGMFGVANNLIPVILSAVHLLWSVDTRVKISWPSKVCIIACSQ